MENVYEILLEILNCIKEKNVKEKKAMIIKFQEYVLENPNDIVSEEVDNILTAFAVDTLYYEPDENIRKEDKSYFGDDVLKIKLEGTIEKIKML